MKKLRVATHIYQGGEYILYRKNDDCTDIDGNNFIDDESEGKSFFEETPTKKKHGKAVLEYMKVFGYVGRDWTIRDLYKRDMMLFLESYGFLY